jgi:hypothetical protein
MCGANDEKIMKSFREFLRDDSSEWKEHKDIVAALQDWIQGEGPHFRKKRTTGSPQTELTNTRDTTNWTNAEWDSLDVVINFQLAKVLVMCHQRMIAAVPQEDMPTVTRRASSIPEIGTKNFQYHDIFKGGKMRDIRQEYNVIFSNVNKELEDNERRRLRRIIEELKDNGRNVRGKTSDEHMPSTLLQAAAGASSSNASSAQPPNASLQAPTMGAAASAAGCPDSVKAALDGRHAAGGSPSSTSSAQPSPASWHSPTVGAAASAARRQGPVMADGDSIVRDLNAKLDDISYGLSKWACEKIFQMLDRKFNHMSPDERLSFLRNHRSDRSQHTSGYFLRSKQSVKAFIQKCVEEDVDKEITWSALVRLVTRKSFSSRQDWVWIGADMRSHEIRSPVPGAEMAQQIENEVNAMFRDACDYVTTRRFAATERMAD